MTTSDFYNRFGIRARIFSAAILPALLISILLGSYYIVNWIDAANERLHDNGSRYSIDLSKLSEFALFTSDENFLNMLSSSLFSDPDVYSVMIINDQKQTLSHKISPRYIENKPPKKERDEMIFMAAVYGGQLMAIDHEEFFVTNEAMDATFYPDLLGWVEVVMTDDNIIKLRRDMLINTLLILSAVLVLAFFVSLYLAAYITRPIVNMKESINKIAAGAMAGEVNLKTGVSNELGDLESAFYEMAVTVKNSQFELQKKIDIATASHKDTIAHLEKNNMELVSARETIQKANEETSGFLARMSHEIRTPIHSIMGFVNLIKRTSLDNTQHEYVRVVGHASEQLLKLINDVLDISSLESNAIKLENDDFNLRDCVEDVTLFMRYAAHKKGLELVYLIDSDVPLKLIGDQYHLKQIIMNLVSNAIKFTRQGEVVIAVSLLSANENTAKLSISVSDTGMGISADHLSKIQEPFFQADSSKTRNQEGTGLGLAIVKTLVSMMSGELLIKSQLGSGSRFDCIMELNKQVAIQTISSPGLEDKKTLCCDEHPLALRSIRNQMLAWSNHVYTAPRLDRAEYLLRNAAADGEPFDLLIIGINKITADSALFIKNLQTIKENYPIPFLLMVGDEGRETCHYFSDDHDCLCITKPVAQDYLLQSIQSMFVPHEGFDYNEKLPSVTDIKSHVVRKSIVGMKVLLVEDNDFNRLYVSSLLSDRGFKLTEAITGIEAVAIASEGGFDLILMDIHLPEMDGLVAARKIRDGCPRNCDTPIIALTADLYINKSIKAAGINDVISKPINEVDFWTMIDQWLVLPPSSSVAYTNNDIQVKKTGAIKQGLLPRLIEELPDHSRRINEALVKLDHDALAEHLHQLKGVAGYFQLKELSAAAAQADTHIRKPGDIDVDEVRAFIHRIDKAIKAIVNGSLS